MIKFSTIELISSDFDSQYIGYLNLLCSKASVFTTEDSFLTKNYLAKDALIALHEKILGSNAWIFLNYKNFNGKGGYSKITGFQNLLLCLFLHDNNYEYGSYEWELSDKPEVILPFWYKEESQFHLDYFGFSCIKKIENPITNESIDLININQKSIYDLWSSYAIHGNLKNPFFFNFYNLIINSVSDDLSLSFNANSLNTNFIINNSIDELLYLFPQFLNIVDCILYELDLVNNKKIIDIKPNIEIIPLNDYENSGLSFEMNDRTEIKISSNNHISNLKDTKIQNDSILKLNEYTRKYDNNFLIEQNKIVLDDVTILKLLKSNSVYFLKNFIEHEKIYPNNGFFITFIEYLDSTLNKYLLKINSLKLVYLKMEAIYSISFILTKSYIYKFFDDNYINLLFNEKNIVMEKNIKNFILAKYKSLNIFILNKLKPIVKLSPDYFDGFTTNQLVFYYFKYFSTFKNYLILNNSVITMKEIEDIYQDELNKIQNLESSFFFYLAEFIPCQIRLIKN